MGCTCAQTGDIVTVTIGAGTAVPSGGFDLTFKMPVPDNSLNAQNPEYQVTINSITGTIDVYEKYEIDSSAPQTVAVIPDNETNLADMEGITASLTVSPDAEEGGSIAGCLEMSLQHTLAEGTDTLVPLDITLKL